MIELSLIDFYLCLPFCYSLF
nr:truncated ORF7b [Severe acute respiratory syndrome coronavirus 2]QTY18743.1 truncated ORF7b [Severe acute respiratory syndrome coronavirus 2]QTY18803.1 truncated ORF7b [Severe acute respiratory syndrome coronavirus 2]QTY18839.1 truncated ORF7b [Severe acute respiratory syndrome coronavirus 2]QTY18851.1 truncated ORF7b [Severe acute respiratory syndrome coronavirus 2]